MAEITDNNEALNRSESLIKEILKVVDLIPSFLPQKSDLQGKLDNLRSVIQGLRPARIMYSAVLNLVNHP
ncbi:hypothetical protein H6G76_28830 [Nostoc sp. FACHB-152]|uniref:hypothetical protein n=1 Tax=unclassified Nostoc TaxID=2593658 RepID=UPI001682D9D4|nr:MULTISPECIES: hypothetical protein [unclassified Nostoc]MBD2451064.1 hypothetical protein [Nostoc sp. FACHB-152]MBD2471102.1 hypothetical protein [Nostoc sp. FACHB-145]